MEPKDTIAPLLVSDLFEVATLLALTDLPAPQTMRDPERPRTILFIIPATAEMRSLRDRYQQGRLLVEPMRYRQCLDVARDLIAMERLSDGFTGRR